MSGNDEHIALLLKKIQEMLGDLVEAHGVGYSHEINETGCDLIDAAVSFLMIRTGISPEQITERIEQKRRTQGGYLFGLVRESE